MKLYVSVFCCSALGAVSVLSYLAVIIRIFGTFWSACLEYRQVQQQGRVGYSPLMAYEHEGHRPVSHPLTVLLPLGALSPVAKRCVCMLHGNSRRKIEDVDNKPREPRDNRQQHYPRTNALRATNASTYSVRPTILLNRKVVSHRAKCASNLQVAAASAPNKLQLAVDPCSLIRRLNFLSMCVRSVYVT